MATVVPEGFQTRVQDMVNNLQERIRLLQAGKEVHVGKKQVLQKQKAKLRQVQQVGLNLSVKAEEMICKIKAVEDRKKATNLALKGVRSKMRVLREELVRLQKERDEKCSYYASNGAEMHEFTRQLQARGSTIFKETEDLRRDVEELKRELKRLRQLSTTYCEIDAAIQAQESERTELIVKKQIISRFISSNMKIVNGLEERLHEALQVSYKKKRDLAALVEKQKEEITALQAKNRVMEDQVVQSMTRRDEKKRQLHEVETQVAQKKKMLYSCKNRDT